MNDRVAFVQSLDYTNFSEEIIVGFFDQIMLVYNLISEGPSYSKVAVDHITNTEIAFKVSFNDLNESTRFQQLIIEKLQSPIQLYGRLFVITQCFIEQNNYVIIKVMETK